MSESKLRIMDGGALGRSEDTIYILPLVHYISGRIGARLALRGGEKLSRRLAAPRLKSNEKMYLKASQVRIYSRVRMPNKGLLFTHALYSNSAYTIVK